MPFEFTASDQSIIRNLMLTKSHRDIASFMECNIEDINRVICSMVIGTAIITHQMKLDKKAADRKTPPKPKDLSRKRVAVQKQVIKQAEEKQRSYSEVMKVERQRRNLNREPRLPTKHVDYSQKISVRIDRKTTIYADPGEDIQALKERFLKTYKPVSD